MKKLIIALILVSATNAFARHDSFKNRTGSIGNNYQSSTKGLNSPSIQKYNPYNQGNLSFTYDSNRYAPTSLRLK
jgi:hypothetical protein